MIQESDKLFSKVVDLNGRILRLEFKSQGWDLDLKAGIGSQGWDLDLKAGILASRLGFGPQGWDLGLKAGI